MRIIKEPTIKRYWLTYPNAEPSLAKWLDVTRKANWTNLQDVRRDFPNADGVVVRSGNVVTVFNISGNNYRLVVSIKYKWSFIYVRDFMSHAEYSNSNWKGRH